MRLATSQGLLVWHPSGTQDNVRADQQDVTTYLQPIFPLVPEHGLETTSGQHQILAFHQGPCKESRSLQQPLNSVKETDTSPVCMLILETRAGCMTPFFSLLLVLGNSELITVFLLDSTS